MISLGVPEEQVVPLLPLALGLLAAAATVVGWAHGKVKDVVGLRYNRVLETAQTAQLAAAVRLSSVAVAVALIPGAVLIPSAAAVVHAAIEPPRAYSTVKAALLAELAITVIVVGFALSEALRARRARASWLDERAAVVDG